MPSLEGRRQTIVYFVGLVPCATYLRRIVHFTSRMFSFLAQALSVDLLRGGLLDLHHELPALSHSDRLSLFRSLLRAGPSPSQAKRLLDIPSISSVDNVFNT